LGADLRAQPCPAILALVIHPRSKSRQLSLGGEPSVDALPDARDGLNRLERVILVELERAQRELNGRSVPSALLYGRVAEHLSLSPQEFQRTLALLVARAKRPL
jgi:hypothetical protein